jgi:propanediol dehydratase small subunit
VAALTYPLGTAARDAVRAASGRAVSELTLAAVAGGDVGADDLRVSPETLRLQADFAEGGGNRQLAENLRRGAELCAFSDGELLRFYEMLRPGRSSAAELDALADELAGRGADLSAALVREARAAYIRRALIGE